MSPVQKIGLTLLMVVGTNFRLEMNQILFFDPAHEMLWSVLK